jgi:hypothetical protein
MIANAKCQHCGNQFETDGMNRTEFCPHCGKENSISGQVSAPAPAYTAAAPSTAATLQQIRQQTCYKTLRGLIYLIEILFFVAAGLAVIYAVLMAFQVSQSKAPDTTIFAIIGGVISAVVLSIMGIAWQQAAMLLIDIADCQIRLAGNKS